MQAGHRAGGGPENRHAIVVERLLFEILHAGHAGRLNDVSHEPAEQVYRVRPLLDELAAGGLLRIRSPFILIARPAADAIPAAREQRFANSTPIDDLLRLPNRGMMPVVESAFQNAGRFFRDFHHFLRFSDRTRQRLLTKDMLAGPQGRQADFSVNVRRRADKDGVDILASDRCFQSAGRFAPHFACDILGVLDVQAVDDRQLRSLPFLDHGRSTPALKSRPDDCYTHDDLHRNLDRSGG